MHNKFLLSVLCAVLLGGLLGHFLFLEYQEETMEVMQEKNKIYFIQEGVYDNEEEAKKATAELDTKIIVKEDAKYYVYLAMTQSEKNLEKLKKFYQNQGINITIKEMEITDESFINTLIQMDGLLEDTTKEEQIDPINKVVLANYQELILEQ
ncbi:MAG TPA: hypothetical protein IAC24_00425 [Candidatus Onthousia faecigallinarum]|nr:hypothetical protein [Candidatus Onthousia faecigallinarum]